MKKLILMSILVLSMNVIADKPKPDGKGGVKCNPGCPIFDCGKTHCKACNEDGCVTFPHLDDVPGNL